jgi:hypothetical protein
LRQPSTGLTMTKALVALARTAASVMVRAVLPAATARIASVVDVKQVGRELGVRLCWKATFVNRHRKLSTLE